MTTRRQITAGLMASLLVAACGNPRPPELQPAPGAVLPPKFDDADPHPWDHRTPAALPVHGIDVNRYQPGVDWHEVRRAGTSFAFIKATEGGDGLSPEFEAQWHGSQAAGVPRSAFHFYYFCTPAEVQARWFIRNAPRQAGSLPPALNLEWNPFSPTCRLRPPPETVRSEVAKFVAIVAAHYGQRPILYAPVDFFEANDLARLRGEEFWLRSVAAHPEDLYPGVGWSFWQYSGTGRVPGVAGNVDLNAFAGSVADWQGWLARRRI
jgi:lysozyme